MIFDAKKYSGKCLCGREHKMTTEFAVIESGCLKDFEKYLSKLLSGVKKLTAIYDENTYNATKDRRPNGVAEIILSPENLHADENVCADVLSRLAPDTEALVAVGSGTIHDITRFVANERKIPFISCPTAASVDGFCSSVAAMTWHGFKKTFPSVAPKFVLADLDIISRAPIRMMRSGFGDIVGKFTALADWKMAEILTGEFLCPTIYGVMSEATKTVVNSAKGLAAGEIKGYEDLTYGLIMSGIAMQMMGNSRPASGAEHHISHLIEMSPSGLGLYSTASHGEKVGVATVLVTEEYKKILGKKINAKDYVPVKKEEIMAAYGDKLYPSILSENENDCAFGITAEKINSSLPELKKVIDEIPSTEKLVEIYDSLGVYHKLSDIGVDEKFKEEIFKFSPTVRNRLTLMRLRRSLLG